MKNIIKLGLSHLGVLALIAYLQKIVKKMTGNAKFITLADQTTALDTAVAALETANTNYEAAKSTAEQLLTVRDNAVRGGKRGAGPGRRRGRRDQRSRRPAKRRLGTGLHLRLPGGADAGSGQL